VFAGCTHPPPPHVSATPPTPPSAPPQLGSALQQSQHWVQLQFKREVRMGFGVRVYVALGVKRVNAVCPTSLAHVHAASLA
jgi:hypothetical protein